MSKLSTVLKSRMFSLHPSHITWASWAWALWIGTACAIPTSPTTNGASLVVINSCGTGSINIHSSDGSVTTEPRYFNAQSRRGLITLDKYGQGPECSDCPSVWVDMGSDGVWALIKENDPSLDIHVETIAPCSSVTECHDDDCKQYSISCTVPSGLSITFCSNPMLEARQNPSPTGEDDPFGTDIPPSPPQHINLKFIGPVIGGVVGGAVLLVGLILLLCIKSRQSKYATRSQPSSGNSRSMTFRTVSENQTVGTVKDGDVTSLSQMGLANIPVPPKFHAHSSSMSGSSSKQQDGKSDFTYPPAWNSPYQSFTGTPMDDPVIRAITKGAPPMNRDVDQRKQLHNLPPRLQSVANSPILANDDQSIRYGDQKDLGSNAQSLRTVKSAESVATTAVGFPELGKHQRTDSGASRSVKAGDGPKHQSFWVD